MAEHEAAQKEDYLALWLKSSANSKYLIDCVVSGQFVPFKVIGPNLSASQISSDESCEAYLLHRRHT